MRCLITPRHMVRKKKAPDQLTGVTKFRAIQTQYMQIGQNLLLNDNYNLAKFNLKSPREQRRTKPGQLIK